MWIEPDAEWFNEGHSVTVQWRMTGMTVGLWQGRFIRGSKDVQSMVKSGGTLRCPELCCGFFTDLYLNHLFLSSDTNNMWIYGLSDHNIIVSTLFASIPFENSQTSLLFQVKTLGLPSITVEDIWTSFHYSWDPLDPLQSQIRTIIPHSIPVEDLWTTFHSSWGPLDLLPLQVMTIGTPSIPGKDP